MSDYRYIATMGNSDPKWNGEFESIAERCDVTEIAEYIIRNGYKHNDYSDEVVGDRELENETYLITYKEGMDEELFVYTKGESVRYYGCNSDRELYRIARKYGDDKKYPYAMAAIAYYIFGDRDRDNIISEIYRGEYGHNDSNRLVDDTQISALMLEYEFNWHDLANIDYINDEIANMELKCGDKVREVF